MRPDQTALAGRVIPAVSLVNCPGAARAASGAFSGVRAPRKAPVRPTAEMWREALELHSRGLTWNAIGKRLNITGRALLGRYHRETGERGSNRRVVTATVANKVLELRAAGRTVDQIAAAVGFGHHAVQCVLRAARDRGDARAAYRPTAVLTDAVLSGATEAAEPDLPAAPSTIIVFARNDRLVLSLMARGLSRSAAEDTAAAHRRRA